MAVLQPPPPQRDLDQGLLDEVLGALVVAGQQHRRAQQPSLAVRGPRAERLRVARRAVGHDLHTSRTRGPREKVGGCRHRPPPPTCWCTCGGPATTPTATTPSRIDLAALAAVAGISKYHFQRLFRATYGRSPATYLTERRIERAQDLLRATNLTVTEVCHAVGFSSLGSFSSRFRELVGETPSEFQRRYADGAPHIPGCYVFMWGLAESRNPGEAGRRALPRSVAA